MRRLLGAAWAGGSRRRAVRGLSETDAIWTGLRSKARPRRALPTDGPGAGPRSRAGGPGARPSPPGPCVGRRAWPAPPGARTADVDLDDPAAVVETAVAGGVSPSARRAFRSTPPADADRFVDLSA